MLRKMTDFKTCEECKGPCQLLTSKTNPRASEWYCEKCHRSYDAFEDDGRNEAGTQDE